MASASDAQQTLETLKAMGFADNPNLDAAVARSANVDEAVAYLLAHPTPEQPSKVHPPGLL